MERSDQGDSHHSGGLKLSLCEGDRVSRSAGSLGGGSGRPWRMRPGRALITLQELPRRRRGARGGSGEGANCLRKGLWEELRGRRGWLGSGKAPRAGGRGKVGSRRLIEGLDREAVGVVEGILPPKLTSWSSFTRTCMQPFLYAEHSSEMSKEQTFSTRSYDGCGDREGKLIFVATQFALQSFCLDSIYILKIRYL